MLKRLNDGASSNIDAELVSDVDDQSLVDQDVVPAQQVGTAPDVDEFSEDEEDWQDDASWFDGDTQAFVVSLLFHAVLVLGLAVIPAVAVTTTEKTIVSSLSTRDRGRGVYSD